MSSSRIRIFVVLAVVFATLPFTVGAGNGNGGASDAARAEHQRIVDFWTPERVAQAMPRDFLFDPGTGRFSPKGKPEGTPGGGNGGGGGGEEEESTVVSGAAWKGGDGVDGALGKVLFEMDGRYWVCSATVIDDDKADRSLILTAAHCVYDVDDVDDRTAFATNWMFIPDYDAAPASLSTTDDSFCDGTAYGCWTAASIAVHEGYASAESFGAGVEYDFAVVAVGEGGHEDPIPNKGPQLDANVAPQEISFSEPPAVGLADTYAFGYPAQKKWDGTDLIYCRGPVDTDPRNGGQTYRLNECKLNGGSSGGSWMVGVNGSGFGTVVSVNSYGYRGINAMHGPFLNGYTQAVYNAALAAEGANVVAAGSTD